VPNDSLRHTYPGSFLLDPEDIPWSLSSGSHLGLLSRNRARMRWHQVVGNKGLF